VVTDVATLAVMSISEGTSEQAEATLGEDWTPDDSTFGARLALIRQKMGWGNIAKAAKECGVPTDSWRNWEVDGREPHRLVTIAMAIATRTRVNLDWLVYGPNAKRSAPNGRYVDQRVIVRINPEGSSEGRSGTSDSPGHWNRPVRQTRPRVGDTRRPLSAVGR
jgi:hypothetical protein